MCGLGGGSDKCEVRWCLRCVCGLYSGVMFERVWC